MHVERIHFILKALGLKNDIVYFLKINNFYLYRVLIFSVITPPKAKTLDKEIRKSFSNVFTYFEEGDETDYSTFIIEITKENSKQINLLDFWEDNVSYDPQMLPVGFNRFNEPKQSYINILSFAHVLGNDDSGKYGFLKSLLCHSALFSKPEDLRIDIVDTKNKFNEFKSLKHINLYTNNVEEGVNLLDELFIEAIRRTILFKQKNVINHTMYNEKTNGEKLKSIIVIIDDYNTLLDAYYEVVHKVFSYFDNAKVTGIYLYLSVENARKTDSFAYNKICFKTSLENSINFLDSDYGYVLGSNGDFIYQDLVGRNRYQGLEVDNETISKIINGEKVVKEY